MPGSALINLREELEITEGDEKTREILRRYGNRCGEALVAAVELKCDLESLKDHFPTLWLESGLSRAALKEAGDQRIVVELEESIEASPGERCNFTRGYVEGVLSTLLSRNLSSEEVRCISEGSEVCVFHVTPRTEMPTPKVEKPADTARKFSIETGFTYLAEAEEPDHAYEMFVDQVKHGFAGLVITRDFPKKVMKKWGLDGTPFMWLTMDESTEFAVPPTNLPLIYNNIKKFLASGTKCCVLLAGIEYLVTQTSYDNVLKFILLLNDKIAVHDSLLIVPISPKTLDERQLKMLERECEVVRPQGAG
jgi:predicted hydrocarbon binding protein